MGEKDIVLPNARNDVYLWAELKRKKKRFLKRGSLCIKFLGNDDVKVSAEVTVQP